MKKDKQLGITVRKDDNFSEWYTQVVLKSEMIDYSPVSGCYVIRPTAYGIWEKIQKYFDKNIKKLGVKNAYFPLLIPESLLKKEEKHIKGFSPEVAYVTEAGDSKLDEKLAIRPTSETIMYERYKDWIRSWRDLPLKLNQYNNILRWEFKHPLPFIRSREFLWQEGHTAFAHQKDSEKEVYQILDIYADIYESLLAVPVLKGKKSDKEKFSGADFTTSVEIFLPNGKAVQGATSHSLGQNFSHSFEISFLDKEKKENYVWQNSWGLSTRCLGIMVMVHGDDKGLIIPPAIAENKVVIVPIFTEKDKSMVLKKARELQGKLKKYNVILDDRDQSPGWKFNEWELKGIPIRIEIGPKDIKNNQVVVVRRDNFKKEGVSLTLIVNKIQDVLGDMQTQLLEKARKRLKDNTISVSNLKQLQDAVKNKKLVKAPWCGSDDCEDSIKHKGGGAKILNIPFDQSKSVGDCVLCGKQGSVVAFFAKSY